MWTRPGQAALVRSFQYQIVPTSWTVEEYFQGQYRLYYGCVWSLETAAQFLSALTLPDGR